MTIKQLKETIKDLPDNMDVFMAERLSDFTYGLVNNARVQDIDFKEDPDPDTQALARDNVLILSEE